MRQETQSRPDEEGILDISALYYALWKVFKQRIGTFALFYSRTRTIAIGERERETNSKEIHRSLWWVPNARRQFSMTLLCSRLLWRNHFYLKLPLQGHFYNKQPYKMEIMPSFGGRGQRIIRESPPQGQRLTRIACRPLYEIGVS